MKFELKFREQKVVLNFGDLIKFLRSFRIYETWIIIFSLHLISFKIICRLFVVENFEVPLEALICMNLEFESCFFIVVLICSCIRA
jgi:hypothetical protein